jgi:serine/threonine-protein kinase
MLQDDELMVKVLLKVACALEWLHARGYVHMDLKCANILLDLTDPDEPVVMLADLGLTKFKRADWFTSGTGCGTMQW